MFISANSTGKVSPVWRDHYNINGGDYKIIILSLHLSPLSRGLRSLLTSESKNKLIAYGVVQNGAAILSSSFFCNLKLSEQTGSPADGRGDVKMCEDPPLTGDRKCLEELAPAGLHVGVNVCRAFSGADSACVSSVGGSVKSDPQAQRKEKHCLHTGTEGLLPLGSQT